MNVALMLLIALLALAAGYIFYGRYLSRTLGIAPDRETPAHTMTDGVDYVPAKAPVLFGHHFASIAGAAPIIGPVTAALFGWVPVFLWILIGSIFLGGTHDMSSLVASLRHKGRSIGEVIEENIGISGKNLFLIFSLSTLILVVAVFASIVAKTFNNTPEAATASILFIVLALAFGQILYRWKLPLGPSTVVGVILLFSSVWVGVRFPIQMSEGFWIVALLVYVFLASVTPVWALLQPRDYLNSFLLYALLISAILGIIITNPEIQLPAFTGFNNEVLGPIFPLLFVTVACGAISGFHSLVASGTTAKQLDNEKNARVIAYGGMLTEGLLAVVALSTVAILTRGIHAVRLDEVGPVTLFSRGVGNFLASLGIDPVVGTSFAALAVSAFALTTLDTATRLGRYAFAELFDSIGHHRSGQRPLAWSQNRWTGTAFMVIVSGALAFSGRWEVIWPIFGSANQLLAALALLAVSAWLAHLGRRALFTRIPMYFMFAVTLTALIKFSYDNIIQGHYFLGLLSVLLFVLAVVLAILSYQSLRQDRSGGRQEPPSEIL
jgi:carbon starvation protein